MTLRKRDGCRQLKEKVPDHSLWRTRFGGGYGLVRQTTKWRLKMGEGGADVQQKDSKSCG